MHNLFQRAPAHRREACRYSFAAALLSCLLVAGAEGAQLNDAPIIHPETIRSIALGVSVIPDPRTAFVPNIGIVEGRKAILVIDTGLGPENGRRVYEKAMQIAHGRRIYLTTTHFHPEHNFGASAFPQQNIILNQAQADELREKGLSYLALFRRLIPSTEAFLKDTVIVQPGITYSGTKTLDLGGRRVELQEMPAHTRGDQIIYVPQSGVLFTGDLVETDYFPVAADADGHGDAWVTVIDRLIAMKPRIVVPGHGALGDGALLRICRDFLVQMQKDVAELATQGESQAMIAAALQARYRALHPDWGSGIYLPLIIAVFYGESMGRPPQFPSFDELK